MQALSNFTAETIAFPPQRPPPNVTICNQVQSWSDEYVAFSRVLNGYLTALCVIGGTVGNVMSVKNVRFTHFDRNRGVGLAASIIVLAFWDTVLLWCAGCYYGVKNLLPSPPGDLITRATPMFHAFSQIANTASIWSVVTITVQRYLATRDPFRRTTRWLLYVASAELSEQHRMMLYSFRSTDEQSRKSPLSMWRHMSRYRRHFRVPLTLSAIAITVNAPAFFEIDAIACYLMPEGRMGYGLQISRLRLNTYYKLVYKVVFRMLVTSCGPNIFILLLTILTVVLLSKSNRSRRQLFSTNESTLSSLELHSSRASMLTMISVALVVKFLLFRSLSFVLDIWEVTFGLRHRVHHYIYLVDISNFLIILNSATNCLIIYRASRWLGSKLAERNTTRNRRQLGGFSNLSSKRKVQLIGESWECALNATKGQIGSRILYAILLKNPQMFASFREEATQRRPKFSCPGYLGTVGRQYASCSDESAVAVRWDHGIGQDGDSPQSAIKSSEPLIASSALPSPCMVNMRQLTKSHPKVAIVSPLPREKCYIDAAANTSDVSDGRSKPLLRQSAIIDVDTAALSVFPSAKKKSVELLSSAKFHKVGQLIANFIGEIIGMLSRDESEEAVALRIRQVGRVHFDMGISFPSTAWREFKTRTLAIIAECDFPNDKEKTETLEAWSCFLSLLIREMKHGMWNGEDHKISLAGTNSLSVYPSGTIMQQPF